MGRTHDGTGFHAMRTGFTKYISLSTVALTLAACGNDTSTSMSGTDSAGTSSSTGATANPTTTNSTNGNSGTTDGGGTASGTGSTSGVPTTGDTASGTGTTGSDTTGQVSTSGPMTTTNGTTGGTTGGGSGTSTGAVSGSTGGGGDTSTGGGSGMTGMSGTTGDPVCLPGDGNGMPGMVDKSYIWIASQDSAQISKVNTVTMLEEARYLTGPAGGTESPSRTAVSADGRYVVVNNRGTGRTTMIAADKVDCVDKNGNGMIDTSTSKADIKAWGLDECAVWSITFPFGGAWQQGPRGVTWSPGTWSFDECKFVEPKVWLGYWSNQGNNTIHVVRIDGATGIVELTLPIPQWNGSGFAPYGAAMDAKFQPWFSSLRGEIARVNVNNNPIDVTRFPVPASVQSYGMTVDRDGNPWIGGCTGPVSVFDVDANKWLSIAGTSACHRGVASSEKYVWVASNGPCGLVQVDRLTRKLIKFHTPPQCSTAIGPSIDIEGYLWLVDQGGWAWKIDQENVQWDKKVLVSGSHYVYSDMTGGQVRDILPQ